MLPDMKSKLRQLLIKHEGYRTLAYSDTKNNITIGIGRNLTGRGAMPSEIDTMFDNDVDYFLEFLISNYAWFPKLTPNRQIALIDMCFAGTKTFSEFINMISALEDYDYETAAKEILNSAYAKEVGQRANDLAHIILTGELPS